MRRSEELCIGFFFIMAATVFITLSIVAEDAGDRTKSCRIEDVGVSADNTTAFVKVTVLRSSKSDDKKDFAAAAVKYCDGTANVTACLAEFVDAHQPRIGKKQDCFVPRRASAREGVWLTSPNNDYANHLFLAGIWVGLGTFVAVSIYGLYVENCGNRPNGISYWSYGNRRPYRPHGPSGPWVAA